MGIAYRRRKAEDMPYTIEQMPRYSDAEVDGRLGVRGYLYCFQDVSARHFCSFGKGNDVIPSEYGICWILSKYHVRVFDRAPIVDPMTLETWIEPTRSPVRLHPDLRVTYHGTTHATAQMELCLASVDGGRLVRLSEIEFPTDEYEDVGIEVPQVHKLHVDEAALDHAYTYTVRYSDLDNNHHMNNLHYVDLVQDAFSSEFYASHPITEMELEYVEQCYEGETIDVLARACDGSAEVVAKRASGATALIATVSFAR